MTTAIFTPSDAKVYGTLSTYPAIVSATYEIEVEKEGKTTTKEVADIHVFGNDPSIKWPKTLIGVPTSTSKGASGDYCTIEVVAATKGK